MRRVAVVAAAVVVAWLAACAVLVLLARHDAVAGVDAVEAIRAEVSSDALSDGRLVAPSATAARRFDRAHRRLSSPVLRPLDVVPVAGRHLSVVRRITGSVSRALRTGSAAMDEARRLVSQPHAAPPDRLRMVDEVVGVLGRVERTLADTRTCGRGPFLSPVADACNRYERELRRVHDAVETGRLGAVAARSFLTGPRRYLVLAANNAEMRAGSGMPLQAGVLEMSGGRIALGDLRPIYEYTVAPGAVTLPDDLRRDWGWTNPTTEWRNLLATPAFDRWAPIARTMWEAAGQPPVDGVLVMDPVAVAKLLRATGPLTADGVTVDADHAVQFLLHDQYVSYQEGDERRDHLAAIAQSTFAAIEAGRWEFGDLVNALAGAVAERHVLLWSAVPDEARGWQRLGADGALDQNAIAVSVLNRGSNKLDWFLRVEADAEVRRSEHGDEVIVRVALHNRTGGGEPAYIAGPHPALDVPYGTYRGLVEVVLPRGTSGARFDGFESYAAAGTEDGFPVIAVPVELAPGASATFTARGDVRGPLVPVLVPSARVPDVWSPGDDGG